MAVNPIHLEEFLDELREVYVRNQMVVSIRRDDDCRLRLCAMPASDVYIEDDLCEISSATEVFSDDN